MKIIPVIDICKGQVVHAKYGQREQYTAVQSELCDESGPLQIVQAILDIYPFDLLYIADLDAISGEGDNRECVLEISNTFKSLQIWLDCNRIYPGKENKKSIIPVVGSESAINCEELSQYAKQFSSIVLSLDFKDGKFLGNQSLLSEHESWPEDVIVLNLSRVGSRHGPDIELIQSVQSRNPGRKIYYGGGTRDFMDLEKLNKTGLTGVLVATLLHNRMLSHQQIANLHSGTQ